MKLALKSIFCLIVYNQAQSTKIYFLTLNLTLHVKTYINIGVILM